MPHDLSLSGAQLLAPPMLSPPLRVAGTGLEARGAAEAALQARSRLGTWQCPDALGGGWGVSAPARGWGPVAQHRGGGEGRSVPSTGGGSALAQEIGRGSAIWTVEEEEFLAPGGEG